MKDDTKRTGRQQKDNSERQQTGIASTQRPKGSEKMDESLSKPSTDNHQRGDSSRYANTSDNENTSGE